MLTTSRMRRQSRKCPTRIKFIQTFVAFVGSQASDTNLGSGRRFMMDLLVGSLMADGGLESSLQTAIKVEIQDMEDARVS